MFRKLLLGASVGLALLLPAYAQAGIRLGIGIGLPVDGYYQPYYFHRHHLHPGYVVPATDVVTSEDNVAPAPVDVSPPAYVAPALQVPTLSPPICPTPTAHVTG
jgi:hypothetical protein